MKSYQIEKGNNLCNKVRFKVILTLVKTEEAFPFFFFFFFFFNCGTNTKYEIKCHVEENNK